MEIKIPKKLTLKHLNLVADIGGSDDVPTQEKINFCADFCNVHRSELERADHGSLLELYYSLMGLFNEIKGYKEIVKEITVNGKKYTFRDIGNNHPSTWWVTCQKELAKGIKSHQIMALCYIEEGLQYNDYDPKHPRIILNPYSDRCKVFENAELIKEYLPINDFFLQKFERYKIPFLNLQRIRKENPQQLKVLSKVT
jgi:hypothetical protein